MQGAIGGTRIFALTVAMGLFGLVGASPATAATQVGATFAPQTGCTADLTTIETVSPQYVIPTAGVITSWSVQSGSSPVLRAKLKLARPAGVNAFTIVAESAAEVPSANVTSTFATRIPVSGGERLGRFTDLAGGDCDYRTDAGPQYAVGDTPGDAPVGSTNTHVIYAEYQTDISATLEPDADGDGFGDETQDGCPSDAAFQAACVAPETTITEGPKSKTKKKAAEFEFSSSVPGSAFECKVDDNSFADCTSPLDVKVGKGKHTFQVRAIAPGGVVDPTPATADWKVKKKKK